MQSTGRATAVLTVRSFVVVPLLLAFVIHPAHSFAPSKSYFVRSSSLGRTSDESCNTNIMPSPVLRRRRRRRRRGHESETKDLNLSSDPNDYETIAMSVSDIQPSTKAKEKFGNKNVLITGASGGLGRSLAHQMAKCGVSALILSARNMDKLQIVADECQSIAASCAAKSGQYDPTNLKVEIVQCDLADTESVTALGTTAASICSSHASGSGCVDVLINNGGISSRSDFVDTSPEVDERVMQVNFFAGARLAKSFVPSMIESGSGGCIIWIGSVQGLLGIPSRTSYAASKFAVQGYCEGLRAELAGSNISVHVASPGYIRTNLSRSAVTGDGSSYGKMDETTASGADPDEVAVTILDNVAKGGRSDFVVAAGLSAKVAIWLRLLAPAVLEKMLVKRYEKSERK